MEKLTPYRLNLLHPVMYYESQPAPNLETIVLDRTLSAEPINRLHDDINELSLVTLDCVVPEGFNLVDISIAVDPERQLGHNELENYAADYIGILINGEQIDTTHIVNVDTTNLQIQYGANCTPLTFAENLNFTFTLVFHN